MSTRVHLRDVDNVGWPVICTPHGNDVTSEYNHFTECKYWKVSYLRKDDKCMRVMVPRTNYCGDIFADDNAHITELNEMIMYIVCNSATGIGTATQTDFEVKSGEFFSISGKHVYHTKINNTTEFPFFEIQTTLHEF